MVQDPTVREAYLEGRLIGLNELISILKETMEGGESDVNAIVRSIVEHVSNETAAILAEMREAHGEHPALIKAAASQAASRPVSGAAPEEALKTQVQSADALLKNLMELQKRQAALK